MNYDGKKLRKTLEELNLCFLEVFAIEAERLRLSSSFSVPVEYDKAELDSIVNEKKRAFLKRFETAVMQEEIPIMHLYTQRYI